MLYLTPSKDPTIKSSGRPITLDAWLRPTKTLRSIKIEESTANDSVDEGFTELTSTSPTNCLTKIYLLCSFWDLPTLAPFKSRLQQFLSHAPTSRHISSRHQNQGKWPYDDEKLYLAFLEFTEREINISGQSRSELVNPSGTLDAPLLMKLHYALKKSKKPFYATTFDKDNRCIGSLIAKGFTSSAQTLMTENSFRREELRTDSAQRTVLPEDYQNQDLRKVHQCFADWVWDHSAAKVVLLFGKANRERFCKRHPLASPIKLFCKSQWMYLILNGLQIERVVFAADHPEAHIGPHTSLQQAFRHDTTLNLAVLLSNCQVKLQESYYVDRIRKRYLKCCRDPELYVVLEAAIDLRIQECWAGRSIPRHDVSAEIASYSFDHSSKSSLTFAQQLLVSFAPVFAVCTDSQVKMGYPGIIKANEKNAAIPWSVFKVNAIIALDQ